MNLPADVPQMSPSISWISLSDCPPESCVPNTLVRRQLKRRIDKLIHLRIRMTIVEDDLTEVQERQLRHLLRFLLDELASAETQYALLMKERRLKSTRTRKKRPQSAMLLPPSPASGISR